MASPPTSPTPPAPAASPPLSIPSTCDRAQSDSPVELPDPDDEEPANELVTPSSPLPDDADEPLPDPDDDPLPDPDDFPDVAQYAEDEGGGSSEEEDSKPAALPLTSSSAPAAAPAPLPASSLASSSIAGMASSSMAGMASSAASSAACPPASQAVSAAASVDADKQTLLKQSASSHYILGTLIVRVVAGRDVPAAIPGGWKQIFSGGSTKIQKQQDLNRSQRVMCVPPPDSARAQKS